MCFSMCNEIACLCLPAEKLAMEHGIPGFCLLRNRLTLKTGKTRLVILDVIFMFTCNLTFCTCLQTRIVCDKVIMLSTLVYIAGLAFEVFVTFDCVPHYNYR